MPDFNEERIMIHFFSNHADLTALGELTGEQIILIPHPYVELEWNVEQVKGRCAAAINRALEAERLVINGDYTLVALVVLARKQAGKPTGFFAMKKLNEPTAEKDAEGNILHRNVLKPIQVRWI